MQGSGSRRVSRVRSPLPSEEVTPENVSRLFDCKPSAESGLDLAVLYVPCSLDSGRGNRSAQGLGRRGEGEGEGERGRARERGACSTNTGLDRGG